MDNKKLNPNFNTAKMFLSAFGSITQVETFQTFYDLKKKSDEDFNKSKKLTKVFHQTFDSAHRYLSYLNNNHAGIFFNPNQTDLLGRQKKNIIKIRALFCDVDDGEERVFPIKPSIVVKTKNGYHYYFLVKDNFPLEVFELMMKAIIRLYNTDPNVCDISRVMRLPGFFHMKNPMTPYLIQIKNFHPEVKYSYEQLKLVFPFSENNQVKPVLHLNIKEKTYEVHSESYFKNIIHGGCPALERSWLKESIPHRERVALMSLAIRTNDGEKILLDRWPSMITKYQLENSKINNLLPWSCKLLQQDGVCQKGDPLFGDKCFISKNGHEPSPLRLAFGVKKAFKLNEVVDERNK